jgi:polysaccharide export outer membrane protein
MTTCSFVSKKKLTYLQFSGSSHQDEQLIIRQGQSVTPSTYKIMVNDNLYIRVITPDPQWSALFNAQTGDGAITSESAGLSSYPVDLEGNIDIPYVGRVNVAGKTIAEIKAHLETVFKNFVADAAITVRLVDSYISIIGEVGTPGRYPITKERLNVFEALALAGDLSVFSNRQTILLIRQSTYGPNIKEFSLSDRGILASEFYYVMPNDIIYAKPLAGKAFQVNSPIWTLFFSTLTSTIAIIAFVRTL